MIGKTLSHYTIVEKIGEGGMGVVYRALDTALDRDVAVKVLAERVAGSADRIARFEREAKAIAKLSHSNILDIHDFGTEGGITFAVTELLEGESLRQALNRKGPLPVAEALRIARAAADGLAAAHAKKIVHRDIKPGNIFLTTDEGVKILDFGLARSESETMIETLAPGEGPEPRTTPGAILGTVGYMAPEQARGQPASPSSDVFALGCVLYEMLTGVGPFRRATETDTLSAILKEPPPPMDVTGHEVPKDLERVVRKALEKEPGKRYLSGAEMVQALAEVEERLAPPPPFALRSLARVFRKPRVTIPALTVMALLAWFTVDSLRRGAEVRRIRERVIPEAMRLAEEGEFLKAFWLAREAERVVRDDPMLMKLWPRVSVEPAINVEPAEADFYVMDHRDPESEWLHLGSAGGETLRLPRGYHRFKIEKAGFESIEIAEVGWPGEWNITLDEAGALPARMARLPGGEGDVWVSLPLNAGLGSVDTGEFLMDKFEATNSEYKDFVDAGGYASPEFWKHDVVKDGRILSWEEAMTELVDETGSSGPASWAFGTFPDGTGDHPVSGVSWYEAAAYCDFRGKSLPTVYHWDRAAEVWYSEYLIPLSNIEGTGLAAVGSFWGSLNPWGIYDMAGNVREWCFNGMGDHRFVLGGAWNDPAYLFGEADERLPIDRAPGNGFRCMRQVSPGENADELWHALERLPPPDWGAVQPFSDEVFQTRLDFAAYDRVPLEADVEFEDDSSPHWRVEKVSFTEAYASGRLSAYVFLPKNASPPFQTVLFFPGAGASYVSSSKNGQHLVHMDKCDFFTKAGRAVIYPMFTGTYEAGGGAQEEPKPPEGWDARNFREVARSIDYLESRDDIDSDRIAFCGYSWGAYRGVDIAAREPRIKASILIAGGLGVGDYDTYQYALRVTTPVLMVNGRYDMGFPYETSQLPLFNALATPLEHKRHAVLDSYHGLEDCHKDVIRESLAWLDTYLGPVDRAAP